MAVKLKPFGIKEQYGKKTFLLGLFISFLIFLPFLIYDQGLFLYYGDFNVQQIPFYQLAHDSIRSGNLGWSHTTDLGANFIGSYSFYLMGSPFFWLTLLFPSNAVPYLMAPLLMLKMALAALGGYVYLKRYVKNKNLAVLGGLLYAFSGYSIYNIFFNHFHEAILVFPFLLAALDEFMETKRRGVLALAVFASCLINYYFFVGQVIFVVIYWLLRMFTYSYKIKLKDFFALLFEAVLGVAATAVLLLPSIFVVAQNNRVGQSLTGWDCLVYGSPQRYIDILKSFFFPQDIPAYPNFTPDSNAKWSSLSAWLPLVGCTGVFAFMQTKSRKHWLKKLIPILVMIAFVPIFNSVFQVFNAQYYARWFYMLILMMILATVISLEEAKVDWSRALTWSGGITIGIALMIGLMPNGKETEEGSTIGLMAYPERFWSYVAISVIGLALFGALLLLRKKDSRKFVRRMVCCMAALAVVYSIYALALGKAKGYNSHDYLIPHVINQGEKIKLPQEDNVRSDFYDSMDNSAMFWQLPSIQAFHSVVPASVMEFYPTIGVPRDVGSRPEVSKYGLRSFTSARWLFNYDKNFISSGGETKMPGWKYYTSQNNFQIFENEYYIPMGFTYDRFITQEEYERCSEGNRHLLLLKAMVLSDEQTDRYKGIVQDKKADLSSFTFNQKEYFKDCEARKSVTCSSFTYDNQGFTATINMSGETDNLVFFSVPYEEGWSATVNGEPVEVEKVNVGFMAVKVAGGEESNIRFTYQTPGLQEGIIISLAAVLVFAAYMLLVGRKKNKEIAQRKKENEKLLAVQTANDKTVLVEEENTTEEAEQQEMNRTGNAGTEENI